MTKTSQLKIFKRHWGKILLAGGILGICSGMILDHHKAPVVLNLPSELGLSVKEKRAIELLIEDEVRTLLVSGETDFTLHALGIEQSLTARMLSKQYHNNEVAADEQFKGKTLLIQGVVTSIDKDILGDAILRLQGKQLFIDVLAYMNSSEVPSLVRLSKGEQVSIVCTGGGMALASAILKNCRQASKVLYENLINRINTSVGDQNKDVSTARLIATGRFLARHLNNQSLCWQNMHLKDCEQEISKLMKDFE